MKYRSTRGGAEATSFEEVILSSFAPDGGLYVPETLPQVTCEQLRAWSRLSYRELAAELLQLYVSEDELSGREIREILKDCYNNFDDPEILPIKPVGPVFVAETWHGPTGAFKDLTLPVLARLVNHFLKKKEKRATILVSTTGDTGSATIHSAMGLDSLHVIIGYPQRTVSRTQELQMTTTGATNATVFAHAGTSDDFDDILKRIFLDDKLRQMHFLLSFNSIHTVRVILNIIHFVYIYIRVVPNADKSILLSVPTGGMGNTVGAYMAAGMGVPIKLLATVNENDIIHRAFTFADFSIDAPLVHTPAMSLDSLRPFNIERLFHFSADGDSKVVTKIMETFEKGEKSVIPEKILRNSAHLKTACVQVDECMKTITDVWSQYNYILCPHSAVAMAPALKYVSSGSDESNEGKCDVVVVVGTATGAKFPETLEKIGVPVPTATWREGLEEREERREWLKEGEDWEGRLRETIAQYS